MEVAHPQSGSSSTWFPVELEFGNVGFWGEGKTEVPVKKPLGAKEVAKFLETNRKRRLKSEFQLFQFLSIIQFHLICQMLATFSGVEPGRTISQFKNSMKRAREIRNRATTAKKCTKKRDATCKVFGLLI